MKRAILHCDCNSFYASVECVLNPELRDVPMAVAGNEELRHGIILAKNELAKKFNIQTAETIWQAKKKCPQLVLVKPHHKLYEEYSKRVMDIYKRYTDYVEPFGIDEAWLDVTGSRRLFGDEITIANELRRTVKTETGLTISVGVSFCKVFAKLGSDYKKPDATTVFSEDNWQQFVYPLSVRELLYVGKKTGDVLEKMGIFTIGQLAKIDESLLKKHLGKMGTMISCYAKGLDAEPVKSIYDEETVKSVGNSITFKHDLNDMEEIKSGIFTLSDSVAKRLREKKMKCTTVQIGIKDDKFKSIVRQKGLSKPTCISRDIRSTAMELVEKNWNAKTPIRMLSVTGTGLVDENETYEQFSLLDDDFNSEKIELLERTVDTLKSRFGDVIDVKNQELHRNLKDL